ncbi:MAG: AraC family transcriptional regulator [Pseudomonadota bacterium]
MNIEQLAENCAKYALTLEENKAKSELTGTKVFVLEHVKPTSFQSSVYTPFLCLIVRGRKEILIGSQSIRFGAGQSLVLCHDLPVVARILEASEEVPYLTIVMPIDLDIVRGLYSEVGEAAPQQQRAEPLSIGQADEALMDALHRYLEISDKPSELAVLGPLIHKEIHFRLLMAPNGGMLRQLLARDSHASRISKAIDLIRQEYRTALAVADLSKAANMSASSFHEHFKSITGTTPLQYQKDLRLIEAKQRLSIGEQSVATIAYDVGYESATQFSREYVRKFGASPREDIGRSLIAV